MTMAQSTPTPTRSVRTAGAPKRSTPRRATTRQAPAKTTERAAQKTATAQSRAAKAPAREDGVNIERLTFIGLGAALEARDRVVGFATYCYETFAEPLTTREGATKQLRKFERRGRTERKRIERRAKSARTRVERELRLRRREAERFVRRNRIRLEREVRDIERTAERRPNVATQQVTDISHHVENAVQAGYSAGEKVAKQAVPS